MESPLCFLHGSDTNTLKLFEYAEKFKINSQFLVLNELKTFATVSFLRSIFVLSGM